MGKITGALPVTPSFDLVLHCVEVLGSLLVDSSLGIFRYWFSTFAAWWTPFLGDDDPGVHNIKEHINSYDSNTVFVPLTSVYVVAIG